MSQHDSHSNAVNDGQQGDEKLKDQQRIDQQAKDSQDEYDVGYGKPPKHTQFKKGQSGNPKGRPKRSRNLHTLIREELETPVILQENGKQIKTTKAAAMTKRLVNKALNGDARSIQTLLRMMPQEPSDDAIELIPDDTVVFAALQARLTDDAGREHECESEVDNQSEDDKDDDQ